ncbi:phosphatase PAP2 family protein [candidate division WOR-3 bacterium]|nr:phosphatase PAP2 family protein [candidate division WOR-3 bacterium]
MKGCHLIILVFFSAKTLFSFDPDLRLTRCIRDNLSSPLSQSAMEMATKLGDGRTLLFASTIMSFGDERAQRCGKLAVTSFAISGVLTTSIKISVNRERPDGGEHSFPSGHTSSAFSFAYAISREYPQYSYQALALASVVGVSRIALNRHYFSDVVAGAFIGYFSGIIAEKITDRLFDP